MNKYTPGSRKKIKKWQGEPFINFQKPLSEEAKNFIKLYHRLISKDFEQAQLALGHILDWLETPLI